MPEVRQSEFTRAVRGAHVVAGALPPVEPVVMGLSSCARTAVRRVHQQSPAQAQTYLAGRYAQYRGGRVWPAAKSYLDSLDRYIAWDAAVGAPMRADGIDRKLTVPFGPGDAVRAICHVAIGDGSGGTEARIILWDELTVSAYEAEMIALPVLEAADAEYGVESTTSVSVWQVAQGQQERVLPAAAQAQRPAIAALVATL
jgi:hypothetical protein